MWPAIDKWQAAVQEIADPGNLCRFTQSLDWASFTENSLIFSLRFWIEVFLWASALLRKHFISPQLRRHWTRDAGLHLHYQCLSGSFLVAHRKVLFEEKKWSHSYFSSSLLWKNYKRTKPKSKYNQNISNK